MRKRSAFSPRTASRSISTTPRTLRDDMNRAGFELATVAPHEPERKRIPPAEWESYCAGYYRALQMALVVMGDAEVRWGLYLRDRRRRRVQDAAAAAALVAGREADVSRNGFVDSSNPPEEFAQ